MGLRVSIIRDSGTNCSNGGVSSAKNMLTLVNVEGPSEPTDDAPAATVEHNAFNTVKVVPVARLERFGENKIGPMMGGCYVTTSDSRFGEKLRDMGQSNSYVAIPLHDRYETQKEYNALSK